MPVKLKDFQEKELNQVTTPNKALYWDMGLGKTFGGSEQAIRYGKNILVVCQKSKINDWVEHFENNYNDEPYFAEVCDLTEKDGVMNFFKLIDEINEPNWIEDDLTGETYADTPLDPRTAVGVINYDLLWRRPELLNLKDFTLLLDESSEIQNDNSKRGKFILKMKPSHTILLSGTPTSNGHYEYMWSQVHLLGWSIPKKTFINNYCIKDYVRDWKGDYILGPTGYPIKKIIGYKNEEHMKRKLRLYGASFLKTEEVIDLPEKNEIKLNIQVSKEYNKFIKDKVITMDDITLVGDMVTKQYLYSRYLCGALNKDKLDKLKDLINSTEDRLLIFYNFNNDLEAIKSVIPEDRPISYCNGSVKDLSNYEHSENSVTLIQYQAGAMGLNLQKSNKIIYFSLTNRCGLWQQSMKRTHRLGQERPCFYYYLLCGIEYRMLEVLKTGRDYNNDLFEEDMKNV